jgi:hypothetical protein
MAATISGSCKAKINARRALGPTVIEKASGVLHSPWRLWRLFIVFCRESQQNGSVAEE